VEIYWGSGFQIYVTPIGCEEICVAAISRDSHVRLDRALLFHPELFGRLKNAPVTSTERAALSASRRLPRVYRDRIALVGDGSGSVDAITGEGLRLGLEHGLALAAALVNKQLGAYAATHRALMGRPAFMGALMLSMDHSTWLRRNVLNTLSAEPRIFAAQLAMHVGEATAAAFIRQSMFPLGRRLLAA
jgi:flavin-dependent dehydrogenase